MLAEPYPVSVPFVQTTDVLYCIIELLCAPVLRPEMTSGDSGGGQSCTPEEPPVV